LAGDGLSRNELAGIVEQGTRGRGRTYCGAIYVMYTAPSYCR